MKNQKILDDSATSTFSWTNPVEIEGVFGNFTTYSFGTPSGEMKPKRFRKVYKSISIQRDKFKKRETQLLQFEHQNYVSVQFIQKKKKKINNEDIVSQLTLLSPYVESISISNFIKQKGELYLSNLISIIQQMVNIMVIAQSKQIFHYHLNSNSILLIQNDNKSISQYFLKVCDWGFQNQLCSKKTFKKSSDFLKKICQSSMFQYFHPQLLFEIDNLERYGKYKSKYDIWSFGIILYRLTFFKRPFQYHGSFSPQKLQEYYYKNKKENLKIEGQSLVITLIQKMLSNSQFKNWFDVKVFLISTAQRVKSDFLGIKQIFIKHLNLINYMIQIYKLTAWSINNSGNCFWYENRNLMKKFLCQLLKLILLLHRTKFVQRFGHRMSELSEQQKKQFLLIFRLLNNEWNRIGFPQLSILTEKSFFENFTNFIEYLTPLQTRINDCSSQKNQTERSALGVRIREPWKSMKAIKQFSSRMIGAKIKIQNCNRNIFECLFEILEQNN